jgi:hypothetical protein
LWHGDQTQVLAHARQMLLCPQSFKTVFFISAIFYIIVIIKLFFSTGALPIELKPQPFSAFLKIAVSAGAVAQW